MALVSNIVLDLASSTVVLTATVDSNSVDVITYDNTVNQVTFDARAGIIIDFSEFLAFCDQVNIFQAAILFSFPSIDVFATTPFAQMLTNELHDPGQWNLTVTPHTDPNVVQYEGTQSSSKLNMIERAGSKTLDFPEWLYFLQVLNHYRLSIKGF